MARRMCDFGKLGRVRPWETRIFVVVFLCAVCHGVTTTQRWSIPWIQSGSVPRANSDGGVAEAQVDRELSTTVATSMQCYSCSKKASNAACNNLERQYCTGNQNSCQTELRYVNYKLQITKRCKQLYACENDVRGNIQNCPGNNNAPVCYYCCQGTNCNRELPFNPLNQDVDPRAVFLLTYEVLYNTSQPSPVTSTCGEFYAHRFLEKFVSAQKKLNESCKNLRVQVTVDVKARVRLYGNKASDLCKWFFFMFRYSFPLGKVWMQCESRIEESSLVEVNTYINLSNDVFMSEHNVNECARLVRGVLWNFEGFESEVCERDRSGCFSTIPATTEKPICSQAQMSPKQFTLKTTQWKCPSGLLFHDASKECRPKATPTTTTSTTVPPMTTAITSSVSYSVTTNVEMVSPFNFTSSVSDLSVVTPEPATVFTESTTAAMTTQSTKTTEEETSPLTTTVSMATQAWTSSWGIELLNQSSQLHLLEGGDIKNVYFRLWVNKTELCGGTEEDCSVTLHFSVHPDTNANTPRCRSNDTEIQQIVIGQPSWVPSSSVTSSSPDYCSMSVSEETVDSVNMLPLKAMLDWKYDGSQQQHLHVTLNVTRSGQVEVEETFSALQIVVEDRDRKSTCQSINDPHVTTFDGLEYNNFYEGEFVLYRHTDLPFSVHVIYQLCGHQVLASCNCAVAVQSGDDVIVIDRCVRKRKPFTQVDGTVVRDHLTVMSVNLYLNGQLTPGTRIYQESDGKKYFIYLPHGAYVKVMVSGLLVNVWIVPSPNDIGHTKGLCGTYDWDKSNEFNLRNGSVVEQAEEGEGQRPQPHEFILDWQVDLYGKDSIFRGVKNASDQFTLHRYCTCVGGQPGVCSASHDISTCDIYQGTDVTDLFIKNAVNLTTTVKSRKRRAINENAIIKTDEPILINKGFIPKNTHPWLYGWNETYARSYCTDHIRDNYTLGKLCSQIPGVNFDQEITTCVEDIHIIGNDSWLDSAREAMKEQCLDEIQKNGNLPRNITQQIEAQMCVNDCSGHGQCVDGQCRCKIGFTSTDCSVKVNEPPFKVELPKYGLCDRRYMRCDAVIVYGKNFVNSITLKCHLQKCQVMEKTWKLLSDAPFLEKAQFINFNAVECPIPNHNQSYIIKVTNNGVALSAGLLFIPFDSRCNDCSTNHTRCPKKRDSCIIEGECYADKDLKDNSNDSCEVCDSDNNQYDWTTLQVARCQPPWWQNVPDWVVALVAAVGGSLVGLFVGFLLYKCCCKSRRKPDPAQEVALDNQTDIIASSPFEDHMLHRNRGLPAYSGGGDQFADLTLRQPDFEETYFYNDGRGVENGIDSNTYFY